jgi:hypothetical protein
MGWRDKPLLKGRFSMRYGYSVRLLEDVNSRVRTTLQSRITVNITAVAEEVRLQTSLKTLRSKILNASFCKRSNSMGRPLSSTASRKPIRRSPYTLN